MTAFLCHFPLPLPGVPTRLHVDHDRTDIAAPWPRELHWHGDAYLHLSHGVYLLWKIH